MLAYINRGNAYRDSEQLDRAAADYASVIKLAPTDARGWRNRGLIRIFKGDNKGGVADYNKALEYDPSDAFSWNNRGQTKIRLGDKKGAIADFKKALEVHPGLSNAVAALKQLGRGPLSALLPAWRNAVAFDRLHDLAMLPVLALHMHSDHTVNRRHKEQRGEEPPEDQAEHDHGDIEDRRKRLTVEQQPERRQQRSQNVDHSSLRA